MRNFNARATDAEMMDGPNVSEADFAACLADLATVNTVTLARLPTTEELQVMTGMVDKFGDAAYRDILWVLVNSNEFRMVM